MVKVIDYKSRETSEGKAFFVLILQGGIEIIKSMSGSIYATAKKASLPTTFDSDICKGLIGVEMPGTIEKVPCAPYEYTIQETGEIVTLNHRYEYCEDELPSVDFTKIYPQSSNGVQKAEMA